MTTHTMRRWGAVLITGGLLTAIGYLFYPSTASSPLIQPAAALVLGEPLPEGEIDRLLDWLDAGGTGL